MTREGERELVKLEHVNGGDGYIVREAMVTSEEVGEACKMYAKIHLDPGCLLYTSIASTMHRIRRRQKMRCRRHF